MEKEGLPLAGHPSMGKFIEEGTGLSPFNPNPALPGEKLC